MTEVYVSLGIAYSLGFTTGVLAAFGAACYVLFKLDRATESS